MDLKIPFPTCTSDRCISQIAEVIAQAQCNPPHGATYPFEVFVTLHLDDDSKSLLMDLIEAMRRDNPAILQ